MPSLLPLRPRPSPGNEQDFFASCTRQKLTYRLILAERKGFPERAGLLV